MVLSGDGNRSRSRVAETSARGSHWTDEEVRQQSANASMNAAVSGLTDAVRTMGQSVSKPQKTRVSESQSRTH